MCFYESALLMAFRSKLLLTSHSAGVRDRSARWCYKHGTPPEWRILQEPLQPIGQLSYASFFSGTAGFP